MVLTVNHVFDMLLRRAQGFDWTSAILHVMPPRKVEAIKRAEGSSRVDESDITIEATKFAR